MKKILILGYKRHGKDEIAEALVNLSGGKLSFSSSSEFCAEHIVYPTMRSMYSNWRDCFEDRGNHRQHWYEEIAAYNADDLTKLAREMMEVCDVYVGMRNIEELEACVEANIFDHIFWVDALERKPPEDSSSCTVKYDPSYMILIDNNEDLSHLTELKIKQELFKKCENIYNKYLL